MPQTGAGVLNQRESFKARQNSCARLYTGETTGMRAVVLVPVRGFLAQRQVLHAVL